MSLGLKPEWVEYLLIQWAGSDMLSATKGLRVSSVSPMFERWGIVSPGDDDYLGGFSEMELEAMRKACEVLRDESPELFAAVLQSFKPWAAGPPGPAFDRDVLDRAALRLAELVDKEMGE